MTRGGSAHLASIMLISSVLCGNALGQAGKAMPSKPTTSSIKPCLSVGQITCELIKIDSGAAWVSPYWGYNAPKLVCDGEAFYTLGLWGEQQATARGAIYKYQAGHWVKGYEWPGLNYQPGMLLLDSQQRLIVIYAKMLAKPVILRSLAPGDISNFESLPVPDTIPLAGYIGAGIYGDKLVIGYIGAPGTYSFSLAVLDLTTQRWSGPYLLAHEQRDTEPFTTWLYPIIQPDEGGVHLVVSNNPGKSIAYGSILYMYIPYLTMAEPPKPEIIAEIAPPARLGTTFGMAMCRTTDGNTYITGTSAAGDGLYVFRRGTRRKVWDSCVLPELCGPAAVFEDRCRPRMLWLTSADRSNRIVVSRSNDQGRTWKPMLTRNLLSGATARSLSFLHQISSSSGSVMPKLPCAVLSTHVGPTREIWFIRLRAEKE